jgi:selenide, water dikinase
VFYDAQTSGGMLIALPGANAEAAVARARERGAAATCVIGEVAERRDKAIILKP